MKQRQKPEIGFGECLIINVSGIAARLIVGLSENAALVAR